MACRLAAFIVCLLVVAAGPLRAEPLRLAVAANFASTAADIAALFAEEPDIAEAPVISVGASGQLAAQLMKGAPFDLFLSADTDRVQQLVDRGFILPGDMKIYARGRLVFWQPGYRGADDLPTRLQGLSRLAHANERLAPYGRAAHQVLQSLNLSSPPDIVRGQSVGQVYAMIHSGAVAGGFVALSQVQKHCMPPACLDIAPALHGDISQAAGLMKASRSNPAAQAFYAFLDRPAIRRLIAAAGYRAGAE